MEKTKTILTLLISLAQAFLEKVNEILHSKLGLSIMSPQKKGRAFAIHFGGYENLVRLYEYMYKDSTVSLDRKRTHFQGAVCKIKLEK